MPLHPVSGAAPAATVLVLLLASGCAGGASSQASDAAGGSGGSGGSGTSAPDDATKACRTKWEALGRDVAGRDTATTPSTLPGRWNSVAATIDYYVTSATAKDCGSTLSGQRTAMSRLEAFNERLAPWDLALTASRLREDAATYAGRSKPVKVPGKKGRPARTGPQPKAVARAMATLRKQAPLAARQQGPAWQQATATDPGDRAAVAKAVKDVRFLSSESAAYRAGSRAADQVRAATRLLD